MCGWVGVVPASEVTVVAGDDGVSFSLLHVLPVPLSDARATGVGQHQRPNLPQRLVLVEGESMRREGER